VFVYVSLLCGLGFENVGWSGCSCAGGWLRCLGFADDEFDVFVVCCGFEYLVAESFDESFDVFFCCGVVCGYLDGLAVLHGV